MSKILGFIILNFVYFISNVIAYNIRMHALYMTNGETQSIVETMLNSYGIPFDKAVLPSSSITLENGSNALFNSIIIEGADSTNFPDTIKTQIEEYQKKYSIRVVYLNSEPDSTKGFTSVAKESTANGLYLTPEIAPMLKEIQMKSPEDIFDTPNISVVGTTVTTHTHYNVQVDGSDAIQLLKYNDTQLCAGALLEKDGVDSMYFYFPFVDSIITYFVSHLWISWSNHNLINGYRRVLFSMQVDDFFANNLVPDEVPERYFRTSVDDMKGLAAWQEDFNKRLPAGSFYRTELAMNSIPILVESQHKQYEIRNWNVTQVEPSFVKPLGGGDNRWSGNEDTDWVPESLLNDPLYAYFAKNDDTQDDFFWLTHTFSHENLNFASKFDVQQEIGLNIKMAGNQYLNLYDKEWFSKNSIVTPEISGLHNGDCLEAFKEYNVYYGVGDTSRADITNLTNPYIPMMTTMETSNFEGFMVIPRQPTQVYWNIDTVKGTEQYYNNLYSTTLQWSDILELESKRTIKLLLQLRHDPYMFHESNLRNADFPEVTINGGTGHLGLMQQWIEKIVGDFKQYVDWPIVSKKMDELAQTYLNRINRKNCNPEYTIVVDDSSSVITSIDINASGDCKVPLLLLNKAKVDETTVDEVEKVGEDSATAWIQASSSGSRSVKFSEDVKWSSNSNGSNWSKYLFIVIGIIVVIVILVAGYLYIKKRHTKSYY